MQYYFSIFLLIRQIYYNYELLYMHIKISKSKHIQTISQAVI